MVTYFRWPLSDVTGVGRTEDGKRRTEEKRKSAKIFSNLDFVAFGHRGRREDGRRRTDKGRNRQRTIAGAGIQLAPSQREAHAVSVEHEAGCHSKGSFSLVIDRVDGRSICPGHAPRQAKNSSGHLSTGSKTTRCPSRLARTSVRPLGNRHDFGNRTAWLPPFWNSFARSAMQSVYTRVYILSTGSRVVYRRKGLRRSGQR